MTTTTPLTVATFAQAVIAAYCQAEATCCQNDNPGETFNVTSCISTFTADELVPNTNLGLLFAGPTSTNVVLDQTQANACLAAMSGMGCGLDLYTDYENLFDVCSSALVPQLPAGGTGCLTSFDCESGTFCGPITSLDANFVPQVDPLNSSCLAVGGNGSTCTDDGYSTDCQYLGVQGAGQLYCDPSGTCMPAANSGSPCPSGQPQQCTTLLCVDPTLGTGGPFSCQPNGAFENYEDFSLCATYDAP
jgi:hypothetical protein